VSAAAPRIRCFTTSFPEHPTDPAGRFVAEWAAGLAASGAVVSVEAARSTWAPAGLTTRAWSPSNPLFGAEGAPDRLARPRVETMLAALSAGARVLGRGVATRSTHTLAVGHWLVPCGPAALAAGGRVVLYAHGSDVALLEALPGGRVLARALDAGAAHLNFVSADLARRFESVLGRRLRAQTSVLPMGLADSAPDPAALAARLAAWPSISPGARHVVTVGRLVPLKGLDVLARALAGRRDVVWTAAGEGPERATLTALCASLGVPLRLPGILSPSERDALLRTADVYVLPTRPIGHRSEGTPVSLLEAQLAGLACVASDVGGVRDAAAPDAVALVPPGDVDALRSALARFLDGPDAPARRADAGRAAAGFADRYRWARLLPAHRAIVFGEAGGQAIDAGDTPTRLRPGGTSSAWR
jgi:glycosyltransferase involved in cell wall biosynthesis